MFDDIGLVDVDDVGTKPVTVERFVGRIPVIARAGTIVGGIVGEGRVGVVAIDIAGAVSVEVFSGSEKTRTNRTHFLEAALQDRRIEMPFSADVGVIVRRAHGLSPGVHAIQPYLCVKRREAAVEHCATRNAHGAAPCSLMKAMSERGAGCGQTIEMRGLYLCVVQRMDCAPRQVICNHEQKIWL